MFKGKIRLLLLSSLLLSACGGSDSDPVDIVPPVIEPPTPDEFDHKVTGTLAYLGAVAGADVCADLDKNKSCDPSDPQSTTTPDGNYQIDWASTTENPEYYLIANWTETNLTPRVTPALISSQFKSSALKVSLNTKSNHDAQSQTVTNTGAVIDNGIAQLMSLSSHNGAINPLTHIEFQRYEIMLEQALSSSDIQLKTQQLAVILHSLYPHSGSDVYQLSPEQSNADEFVTTQRLHSHLTALIGDNLTAILGVDEIFSSSKAALKALIEESDYSVDEYLNSDPIDVRFLVNNTLIAQGYIDTPFDVKIMSENDWQIVDANMMDKGLTPHQFTLAPTHLTSFFTLEYGDPNLSLAGFLNSNNQLMASIVDSSSEQSIPVECWNSQLEKWINVQREDQGYQPVAAEYNNNTVTTRYDGTDVPINFSVDKYHRDSAEWHGIIGATPSAFKLDKTLWPEYIYRYNIEQTQDVMCRIETDYLTWNMPTHNDPQKLTTADISALFWPTFPPNEITINEAKKQLSLELTSGTVSTFEWSLQTSPNDLPVIHIIEVDIPQEVAAQVIPDNYLINDDRIIEIEINKAISFDDINDFLLLTYDGEQDNFSQRYYQHLISLLPSK
ncbi:hypothetical protein HWQ46_21305 [Shewanella sp. D64]|uniref:hypothetical protein n=1 Tax=unclassified Shewanella TaxID=196818 RepID=UPI0022BA28A1|nr:MULTISPECIES: hypothetical protein [unclassified Shewanella]MEC4728077.1 hypothetical protein [Shewanella sp. D64]MEC4738165.1 hypothetical protein [Shewanella sp. E94]WBJ96323.1 hypothetical protein HWQ47_04145 [Shewanella sp. MTB7]